MEEAARMGKESDKTMEEKRKEAAEKVAMREKFLDFLRDAFVEADADGNGAMGWGDV